MFPKKVIVDTWMNQNKSLFSAMKLEKIMLFITLTLIVIVAAFNIISNLVLMVMEKNKDIAILMSMGATKESIMKIFIYQGLLIGIMGTTIGSLIGLSISYVFNKYKLIHLPQDVYFIAYLPFKMHTSDILLIISMAILISFLATIYPAKRAAQISPAESFRYG
jgi:lipoprotein-releasing system permease protein